MSHTIRMIAFLAQIAAANFAASPVFAQFSLNLSDGVPRVAVTTLQTRPSAQCRTFRTHRTTLVNQPQQWHVVTPSQAGQLPARLVGNWSEPSRNLQHTVQADGTHIVRFANGRTLVRQLAWNGFQIGLASGQYQFTTTGSRITLTGPDTRTWTKQDFPQQPRQQQPRQSLPQQPQPNDPIRTLVGTWVEYREDGVINTYIINSDYTYDMTEHSSEGLIRLSQSAPIHERRVSFNSQGQLTLSPNTPFAEGPFNTILQTERNGAMLKLISSNGTSRTLRRF